MFYTVGLIREDEKSETAKRLALVKFTIASSLMCSVAAVMDIADELVVKCSFSQSHTLLAIATVSQSVFVFNLADIHRVSDGNAAVLVKPLARRMRIGENITELQWVLNDTFIAIITSSRKLILMDPLCNVFAI